MLDRIQQALIAIEQEHHVRILYACESGSRAWGIESENSDYDVRFIYARDTSDYLQLDAPRDVIERPVTDELDISGWDIFKALKLLRKSNPPLLEWLWTPIIYREASPAIEELRALAKEWYSPQAVFYHYKHMAQGNYQQYIKGKSPVLLKKYLYVIRPIIALLYLEKYQIIPPTSFRTTRLAVDLPEAVRASIETLIQYKQAGDELGKGRPDSVLNDFIDGYLDGHVFPEQAVKRDTEAFTWRLNEVLAHILTYYPVMPETLSINEARTMKGKPEYE